MVIKWIVCRVPPELRGAFADAQRGWRAVAACPGFCWQIGGWNADASADEACVLAGWRDAASHQAFMRADHDSIVAAIGQAGTYTSCDVALADSVLEMPGTAATVTEAIGQSTVLRIADCIVKLDRVGSFTDAQIHVWAPGMARAGMRAGVFARAHDAGARFVVASLWADSEAHATYRQTVMPALRAQARPDDDASHIAGRVVRLDPSWTVLPPDP